MAAALEKPTTPTPRPTAPPGEGMPEGGVPSAPPAAPRQPPGLSSWPEWPDEAAGDRRALLFWVTAFAVLALILFCDLLLSLLP